MTVSGLSVTGIRGRHTVGGDNTMRNTLPTSPAWKNNRSMRFPPLPEPKHDPPLGIH